MCALEETQAGFSVTGVFIIRRTFLFHQSVVGRSAVLFNVVFTLYCYYSAHNYNSFTDYMYCKEKSLRPYYTMVID